MYQGGRDYDAAHLVALDSCEELTDQFDDVDEGLDVPSILMPDDPLVARCLGDLIDDWQRKGGRLSYDDVTRMSTKRKLSGHQLANLLEGLAQAGVSVSGLAPSRGESLDEDREDDAPGAGVRLGKDGLGMYLAEIGRYPLIWAPDEIRLGRLIKAGQDADAALSEIQPRRGQLIKGGRDTGAVLPESRSGRLSPEAMAQLMDASGAGRRAHDELVVANLRLVVSIARQSRYAGSGVELIDRIQDGNLGLLRAADKFDYTKGYKFSTYATWWIRQNIERGIANKSGVIRLPVHFHDKLLKVLRTQRRLTHRYDREPTLDELASATDMDPATVTAILDWAKPVISLDHAIGENGDLTFGDLLSDRADIDGCADPAEIVLKAARLRDLQGKLGGLLKPRSALIIARRFGLGTDTGGETLDAIGHDLGVTRERVRQLEVEALAILAAAASESGLYEYLITDTHQTVATPPADWTPPTLGPIKSKKVARAVSNAREQGMTSPRKRMRS